MNQAYSRLSTTHGHITDCKLDSVIFYVVLLHWEAERAIPVTIYTGR